VAEEVASLTNSRTKGAVFERQVASLLNEFFEKKQIDFTTRRNLSQYQMTNECDLNIPFHAVECKRYKSGCIPKKEWWDQVCESALKRIPVLVYKFDYKPVRVCLPLYAVNPSIGAGSNELTVILAIREWILVLENNWEMYERMAFNIS